MLFEGTLHSLSEEPDFEIKSAETLHRSRRSLADRVHNAVMQIAGGRGALLSHTEKAWSSITFSGTRHELVLEFLGEDAPGAGEELIDKLPDYEFTIPGQLVADAAITSVDHFFGPQERLTITAVLLLLEEG
jgi:hypothetical protein